MISNRRWSLAKFVTSKRKWGNNQSSRETLLFYGTAAEAAEQHKFVVKKTKQNKNTAKTDGIAEVFNWNKLVYENMLNII